MNFPVYRPRRLRKTAELRRMVQETRLTTDNLILPLFVTFGKNVKKPIATMPGHFQLSVDHIEKEAREIKKLGIPAVILFGIPEHKNETGSSAHDRNGPVQ